MSSSSRHEQAARLLAARPECLESGLLILDDHLELAAGVHVDLLACDGLGDPLVVLFCERDASSALPRVAAITAALAAGRPLLRKLYAERGLDADRPPRFALLAQRFADGTPALLELLGPREVAAYEYRVVRTGEGEALLDLALFARTALPESAGLAASSDDVPTASHASASPADPLRELRAVEPTPEPAPARNGHNGDHRDDDDLGELLEVPAPDSSKALFQRARQSIRALSGEVAESHAGGRLEFRVDAEPLAALRLADDGLHLRIGDGEQEQSVGDEASFNAGLNAVFTHYFSRIARRA